MTERVWDKFLTERDKRVFEKSGFGALAGFGRRPALLVIDVNYGFCDEKPLPIEESIKRWHTSCGEEAWDAIGHIRKLIDKCREKGVPVIYTTGTRREDGWDTGSWKWKNSRSTEVVEVHETEHDRSEIVAEIAPGPRDIVVLKRKPSGFFGTDLVSFLNLLQCDSILVTGTTTSGCVRATVIDAFSYNFRVTIAEEGCFDRSQASHAVNLCDMHAKYADVVTTGEILRYLDELPAGEFELPAGKRGA